MKSSHLFIMRICYLSKQLYLHIRNPYTWAKGVCIETRLRWLGKHPLTMITSSIGNIFRVTGHFCGEFTGYRWRGALTFSLISAWINGWLNNGEADGLRRHRANYGVTVMCAVLLSSTRSPQHRMAYLDYRCVYYAAFLFPMQLSTEKVPLGIGCFLLVLTKQRRRVWNIFSHKLLSS